MWYKDRARAEEIVANDPTGLRPHLTMVLGYAVSQMEISHMQYQEVWDAVINRRYKIAPAKNPDTGQDGFDLIVF